MPFLIAHDIEQIVIQIVAHFVLDVVALRPVDDAPVLNNVEHRLGPIGSIIPNVFTGRCVFQIFLQRMVEGHGGIIGTQTLRHILMARSDNLIARAPDDVEEVELRNPLRSVVVDRLLNQSGDTLKIDGVFLHPLGYRALSKACDHVRL